MYNKISLILFFKNNQTVPYVSLTPLPPTKPYINYALIIFACIVNQMLLIPWGLFFLIHEIISFDVYAGDIFSKFPQSSHPNDDKVVMHLHKHGK